MKTCVICGKEFEGYNSSKYCSAECKKVVYAEKNRVNTRKTNHKFKAEFFEHYGSKCSLCGENDIAKLTIGHIHEDGVEHRKRVGNTTVCVIKDLKANNWPDNICQTECYNCQAKKKIAKQSTCGGISDASFARRVAIEKLGGKCMLCGETDINVLEITTRELEYGGRTNEYTNKRRARIMSLAENPQAVDAIILCSNCNCKRRYKRD